jgi:hypothetical protein
MYPVMIQKGVPFKGWRDHNREGSINRFGRVYSDATGFSCHKAYSWNEGKVIGQSRVVDAWSAGCLVAEVSYAHDYILMPLARKQQQKGVEKRFNYTLFDAEGLRDI